MSIPTATVILLNYNTGDLTVQCLERISTDLEAAGWEIIVVDNGSSDHSAETIRARFPHWPVLTTPHNLGFAGGNNLGLRQARGEALILLNSDVIVSAAALVKLVEHLQARPDAGAISPGLRTATGEPQTFAFGDEPTLGYLIERGLRAILRLPAMHDWAVKEPLEAQWVSGACLCVRRAVIQQVGLLDERFFLYFEDIDWCLRMRRAGWRVYYDPTVTATHLGGAAQPQRRLANRIYYDSLMKFYAKHYGPLDSALLRLALWPYQQLARWRWGRL